MIQKSLSTKPILIADYREEEIIELIKDVKVIKDNLPVGDFLIGEILIERKTFNDFIQSVFDGRIFSQLEEALKNFKKVIFLVEGEKIFLDEKEEKIYFSMLARLIAFNNVSIIFTQSIFESAKFLESLCKKYFEKSELISIKKVKKKVSTQKQILNILCSFPGISVKTANLIMNKFENLLDFFNSSQGKLSSILGEKKGKKIFNLLREKFKK